MITTLVNEVKDGKRNSPSLFVSSPGCSQFSDLLQRCHGFAVRKLNTIIAPLQLCQIRQVVKALQEASHIGATIQDRGFEFKRLQVTELMKATLQLLRTVGITDFVQSQVLQLQVARQILQPSGIQQVLVLNVASLKRIRDSGPCNSGASPQMSN